MHRLKLVYGFYEQVIPTDLQGLFTFSSDIDTTNIVLNSAHKNFLHIPRIQTVSLLNSIAQNYGMRSSRKSIAIDNVAKNNVGFYETLITNI